MNAKAISPFLKLIGLRKEYFVSPSYQLNCILLKTSPDIKCSEQVMFHKLLQVLTKNISIISLVLLISRQMHLCIYSAPLIA